MTDTKPLSMAEMAAADMSEQGIEPLQIAIALIIEARRQVWLSRPDTAEGYIALMGIMTRLLNGQEEPAT